MLREARLAALVRGIEKQVVHESVVCLMEKGSDDRSTFHGDARLNKYFTGMYARAPDLLHRGTCTSSSPTAGALEASKAMLQRLWEGEERADVALMDEVRVRVEELFCGGNGRMVIHPSGTDAETMPLLQAILESRAIARSVDPSSRPEEYADRPERGNVVSLVACAGEVASGTTEARRVASSASRCPRRQSSRHGPGTPRLARPRRHGRDRSRRPRRRRHERCASRELRRARRVRGA